MKVVHYHPQVIHRPLQVNLKVTEMFKLDARQDIDWSMLSNVTVPTLVITADRI